jgi:hypothetical protein
VYGEPGVVRRIEALGGGRWRYTIEFTDSARVRIHTSPPTTIEPLNGPVEHAAAGEFTL